MSTAYGAMRKSGRKYGRRAYRGRYNFTPRYGVKKRTWSVRSRSTRKEPKFLDVDLLTDGALSTFAGATTTVAFTNTVAANNQSNAFAGYMLLNSCSAGSAVDQRLGRRIKCQGVHIRGRIVTQNAANPSVAAAARVLLVWDRAVPPGSNTFPTVPEVLAASNVADGARGAFVNVNNKDRFLILKDMMFTTVNRVANADTFTKNVNFSFDLNGAETVFNSANSPANQLSSISTGALYLIAWHDSGDTANLSIAMSSRVRFIDG